MPSPFCGLPQTFRGENAQGRAQWPRGHTITIGFRDPFPGFTLVASEEIVDRAVKDLNAVCGAEVVRQTTGVPNIEIQRARLGTSGVLAQAQLPWAGTGPNDQLWAQFNTEVTFVDARNPSAQQFPIMPVFQHECWGHNLGLGHEQTPLPSLMDPSIGDIMKFTPDDPMAGELVARYGKPGASPPPPEQQCPIPSLLRLAGLDDSAVESASRAWNVFVQRIREGMPK